MAALASRLGGRPAGGREPAAAGERKAGARAGRPVVFVGLDGADWQLLDGLIASGAMPNLAALAAEGRPGVLTSLDPPLSPLVWTTMVTGVSPLEHGILDFTRFDPETGAREPIGSAERRVPAIWNMATSAGRSVAVFGLWATWPAEPVRGLVVADRFVAARSGEAPPPGSVFPAREEGWARQVFARADAAVDFAALAAYLPWLTAEDHRAALAEPEPLAHPVAGLRRILVETRAVHALAREWLAREQPDLALVYFQGTDLAGHLFAPYAPPRQQGISAEDFARYGGVAERHFREVDGLLGEYRRLAAEAGAVLVLASDHGFHWREGRPREVSSREAATAGRWHRQEGISLLWGPEILPAAREAAGVARICATLLALLGLPPGQGLAGPPLLGVEAGAAPPADYRAGFRPAGTEATPTDPEAGEAVARLKALGYLGEGESGPASREGWQPGSSRTPASFNNEGLLLRGLGRNAEAVAAFERALALEPGYASALWNLSELLVEAGIDPERGDALLRSALAAGLPEGPERAAARARHWGRQGRIDRALAVLDATLAARPEGAGLHLLRGRYRLEQGNCRGAAADFGREVALGPGNPLAHASLGLARACLGDVAGARRSLERSLALEPEQPQVREALASLGGASR
jgi:Flp pilus assembly protein TadD